MCRDLLTPAHFPSFPILASTVALHHLGTSGPCRNVVCGADRVSPRHLKVARLDMHSWLHTHIPRFSPLLSLRETVASCWCGTYTALPCTILACADSPC